MAILSAGRTRDMPPPPLQIGGHTFSWGTQTYLMGIVNASPDSFAGGLDDPHRAVEHGLRLAAEGADILDVGGQSTRPGAVPVPEEVELRRVLPVIEGLAGRAVVPISVDTSRASVAEAALSAGATIVNDVTGLGDDDRLAAVVERTRAAVVVMANHRRPLPGGVPETPDTIVSRTRARWRKSLARAAAAGISSNRILVDPGLGFGIDPSLSLELLRELPSFIGEHALLVGPSRKGFIGRALGGLPVEERLEGTLATVALAIAGGADVVRVHDVLAAHRVRLVADAVCRGRLMPEANP